MHGACPDGVKCKFEHDVTNGSLKNTAPPDYYKCYYCEAAHWISKCTSPEAVAARTKRADQRVARELARETGRSTGSGDGTKDNRGRGRDKKKKD